MEHIRRKEPEFYFLTLPLPPPKITAVKTMWFISTDSFSNAFIFIFCFIMKIFKYT